MPILKKICCSLLLLFCFAPLSFAQPGALDLSFNPAISGNSGADGGILLSVLQPDGKVLIGGRFASYNGTARNRIARLNADGSLDATFNPGTGASNTVWTLALQPDGKILIGGDFDSYNGTTRTGIARLNADGSLDATFNPGSGTSGAVTVQRLALQPDGKILIGGYFESYNGTGRNHIARLNADGSLDAGFNHGTGANLTVLSLALQPDGKILIGGSFTGYNGTERIRIARLNADGSLDAGFNPGTGANSNVWTFAVQPDGKILIGGFFTSYNGTACNYIARLNADGSLDAGFNPGTGANFYVRTLALQPDGKILIGGQFITYNGTARNRIARLNADGSLDATFNPGTGAGDAVWALALQPDGNILIGGDFTSYNGTACNYIARILMNDNFWTGAINNNWDNAGNWSSGVYPSPDGFYIVNSGTPELNIDFSVTGSLTLGGTGSLTVQPGRTLSVAAGGTANFGGRPVTLRSTSEGTASIGQVSGTLTGSTNVTVERYLPAKRKWRGLTVPLTGSANNSIFFNWQNNGVPTGSTGAIIWAPAPTGTTTPTSSNSGIYQGGVASSILSYNSVGNNWTALNSINSNVLFTATGNNAYMLFATGPYNTTGSYITSNPVATTLKATGTLRTGNIDIANLTDNRFHFIGNPYASAVNFNLLQRTNLENRFWVWDPNAAGTGAYKLFDNGSWLPLGPPIGSGYTDNQGIIPSGQAFFVRVKDVTVPLGEQGILRFTEASKNINTTNGGFRTTAPETGLFIRMYNNSSELLDAAMARFSSDGRVKVDADDALKLSNFGENLALQRNNKNLTIERRPLLTVNDTLFLNVWNLKESTYRLQLEWDNGALPVNLTAVLQDRVLNTERILKATGTEELSFTVSGSNGNVFNRFQIVFRSNTITPVRDLALEKGINLYPNPVLRGGSLQLSFSNLKAGRYTVVLYDVHGAQVLQQAIMHSGDNSLQSIRMDNKLASGTYLMDVISETGSKTSRKLFVQ